MLCFALLAVGFAMTVPSLGFATPVSVQCRSNRRWVLGQGPDSRCVILDVAWRMTAGTQTFCFARPSGAHRPGPGNNDVMRCPVLLTLDVGPCEYQEEVYIYISIYTSIYKYIYSHRDIHIYVTRRKCHM